MNYQKSREILDRLSPNAVEIIGNPGTLRDKWPLLSEDDRNVLEEALNEIQKEAEEIGKRIDAITESSPHRTSHVQPSDG